MTTRYVFAWSRRLAEDGSFRLIKARNEADARRKAREGTNIRTTRGAYLTPADEFRAELVRLIDLNEQGIGHASRLSARRNTLEQLDRELALDEGGGLMAAKLHWYRVEQGSYRAVPTPRGSFFYAKRHGRVWVYGTRADGVERRLGVAGSLADVKREVAARYAGLTEEELREQWPEVTVYGESLSYWQSQEWWPRGAALVLAGYAGHDREITVNFESYGQNDTIPDIVEIAFRGQLPGSWKIHNRGTRLEVHPSGRFAGGYDELDLAAVRLAVVALGLGVKESL